MRTNNMPTNILILKGIAISIILRLLFTLLFYQMQRILTHSCYMLQESARMHLILDLFYIIANIDEGGLLVDNIIPKQSISKVGQKLSIFMWLMILSEIIRHQSHHLIFQYSILIDLRHKAKMVEHLNSPSNTSILRKGNKKLLKVAEHYIFPRIEYVENCLFSL